VSYNGCTWSVSGCFRISGKIKTTDLIFASIVITFSLRFLTSEVMIKLIHFLVLWWSEIILTRFKEVKGNRALIKLRMLSKNRHLSCRQQTLVYWNMIKFIYLLSCSKCFQERSLMFQNKKPACMCARSRLLCTSCSLLYTMGARWCNNKK